MNINALYESVTNSIIKEMEAGAVPWVKPWKTPHTRGSVMPHKLATGRAYSGINISLLWGAADANGYLNGYFEKPNRIKLLNIKYLLDQFDTGQGTNGHQSILSRYRRCLRARGRRSKLRGPRASAGAGLRSTDGFSSMRSHRACSSCCEMP
jgi:hypothetical protein